MSAPKHAELIGKFITDPSFRKQLIADPDTVFADHNVPMPPGLADKIKNMDHSSINTHISDFISKAKVSGGPD